MIRRFLDVLRRGQGKPVPESQVRPNELRRDVVQAERRRREAAAAAARGSGFPPLSEEARAPRERPPAPREPRSLRTHALGQALRTRSGLRTAWLAKEVLGPPPALRGTRDDSAP